MRQIDAPDTPGLGKPLPREKPADTRPEWLPTDKPNVYRHRDTGQLKHSPPTPPAAPYVPYIGTPKTWGRVIQDLRRECWRR